MSRRSRSKHRRKRLRTNLPAVGCPGSGPTPTMHQPKGATHPRTADSRRRLIRRRLFARRTVPSATDRARLDLDEYGAPTGGPLHQSFVFPQIDEVVRMVNFLGDAADHDAPRLD